MAVVDWVILGVLGISALISLQRGFVREALSLVVWAGAFILARIFSGNLATLLVDHITVDSVRWMAAFAILFLGTIIIGSMVTYLIVEFVKMTGLSGTDRLLGMFFGAFRGVIILVALVYGAQFTMFPEDAWWQESQIIPHLEVLADWARKTLPGATEQMMSFSK